MPGFRFCRYEPEGALLVLTLDRPEVMNALHPAAHSEMAAALDRFAADPALRVAIITGAGTRSFCTGTDLKALAATGDDTKPATGFAGLTHRFDLWKPVIAAVNGACFGGGMEILGACDLAVAAETAVFGLPEPRVGLAALGGGLLQRLPRQVAMKDAMWMVLRGKPFPASEAKRLHLVNEVVPAAELMASARALATELLECAPLALQASKQVMLQSLGEPELQAALHARYEMAQRMLASEDAREGPAAFAAKRKPVWTGV